MATTDAVRVTGLRDFTRYLQRVGVAAGDLSSVMRDVGADVAEAARPLTRPASGALGANIRPSKTKAQAKVRAGGARVPYAGVQHFGWPGRNIKPNPYLYTALDKRRDQVLARFDQGINNILDGKQP